MPLSLAPIGFPVFIFFFCFLFFLAQSDMPEQIRLLGGRIAPAKKNPSPTYDASTLVRDCSN